MKIRLSLLIIFLIGFCFNSYAQTHHRVRNHDEQWALAKINALPEVKDFMHYAKKEKPLVMIAGDPDSTRRYYWVKVGISNFNMFRTTYDFDIDPKTSQIYIEQIYLYLYPGAHKATLKEWRRRRSDPRFNKPHVFKNGRIIAIKDKT